MFYPLEVILYKKTICFGSRQEKLGAFGFSLLKNYKYQKTEEKLGELNTALLTGLNALRWRQDLQTALPPAKDAILATLDVLKRIKPFGWIKKEEITELFSPEHVQFLAEHLTEPEDTPGFIPGQMVLIDGFETHNGLQVEAAALAERMYDTLEFYANLFEELPRLYLKLHHLAQRFAWCDKHTPSFLYAIANTEIGLNTTVVPQTSYGPVLPPNGKKTFPGKRLRFSSYSELVITELFEGMQVRHYVRLCRVCGKPFFMESCRNQKYCEGMSTQTNSNGQLLTCRQAGAKNGDAEKAGDNPILATHKKVQSEIRTDQSRGNISPELAEKAKQLATDYMDNALLDPAYAAAQYKTDMKKENLYAAVKADPAREQRPA